MNEAPVSCLPTHPKMSRAKKVIEEAKEIQNPELDLADKGITTFEEMPGLCKYKLVLSIMSFYKNVIDAVSCKCRDASRPVYTSHKLCSLSNVQISLSRRRSRTIQYTTVDVPHNPVCAVPDSTVTKWRFVSWNREVWCYFLRSAVDFPLLCGPSPLEVPPGKISVLLKIPV
ncbi:Ras suppressor protein 1 [Homalodisca vitripennis]|nr:Ras suppressor protein 1 [Homalodisca vitripennis]